MYDDDTARRPDDEKSKHIIFESDQVDSLFSQMMGQLKVGNKVIGQRIVAIDISEVGRAGNDTILCDRLVIRLADDTQIICEADLRGRPFKLSGK